MHILFISDNFPPEVNAPASRTYEHCLEWSRLGHRVTVITCAPNFPQGRVFPGYRNRLWQREEIDGIAVIRVWSYITANERFMRRVLDYLSFMVSSSLAGVFVPKMDVVIGTSPQFFAACAAWFVAFARRKPFVFELRDLWPESIKAVGAMRDSLIIRLLEKVELFLYRRAARVVSVTHSFRSNLVTRGIDAAKIDVVTNGVDVARFSPRPRDRELESRLGLGGKFVAGYIGTHGMAHGLETLIEAARRMRSLADGKDFAMLFLGDGASKNALRERAGQLELDNVIFVDTVPKHEVARYWSLLDLSIIHLREADLFKTVIPSKLFESMGMGVPVLLGVAGESADIVVREGVGSVFQSENVDQLMDVLCHLRQHPELTASMRERCLQAAQRYDRAALAKEMLNSIQRAAGSQSANVTCKCDKS